MKIFKRVLVTILIATLVICSSACKPNGSAVDFFFFNTVIHVETHDFTMTKQTKTELQDLFKSLDTEFDANNLNSTVYKINNAQKNQPIKITDQFVEVFNIASECNVFTNNLFNPAIYPLVKLWQFDNYPVSKFSLPSEDDVVALLGDKTDFTKFNLNNQDANDLSISKDIDDLCLDFGGILKGYATDKAFEILSNNGHKKGYVNIGGSSLYLLNVKSLGIRHPRATEDLQTIISVNGKHVKNLSVSTSGDYERFYTHNGKTYSHIINSINGYPTDTGVISATVIGASGAFGDAVTTALCLTEHEYGKTDTALTSLMKKIIARYPNCQIYAVYSKNGKNEILTNKKQGEHFTLQDNNYSVVTL